MSREPDVGVASIQAQHEQLIALFNEFEHCIKSDAALEVVQDVVQRAITCANEHFAHEEELIERTGYPAAEEHKFLHRHMRLEFTTLVGNVLTTLSHDPVALEHVDRMRSMLSDHITGPDKELEAHLVAAGIR